MKYFHREGIGYISVALTLTIVSFSFFTFFPSLLVLLIFFLCVFFLVFTLQFFRYPERVNPNLDEHYLISPADGKLVVNEIVEDGRRQLSIFMSPLNVHANWIPIDGRITRSEYIPGKYLVAWHPKSSIENERHEIDILFKNEKTITVKQIAGAVARRVRCYIKSDHTVHRSDELGFIKFGSRIDVLIPADAEVRVQLNEKVKGNTTVLAVLENG